MTFASQIIDATGRPAAVLTSRAKRRADLDEVARSAREMPVALSVDGPWASHTRQGCSYVRVTLSGACERVCVGSPLGVGGLARVRRERTRR